MITEGIFFLLVKVDRIMLVYEHGSETWVMNDEIQMLERNEASMNQEKCNISSNKDKVHELREKLDIRGIKYHVQDR